MCKKLLTIIILSALTSNLLTAEDVGKTSITSHYQKHALGSYGPNYMVDPKVKYASEIMVSRLGINSPKLQNRPKTQIQTLKNQETVTQTNKNSTYTEKKLSFEEIVRIHHQKKKQTLQFALVEK